MPSHALEKDTGMKTHSMTAEEMAPRIARFSKLERLSAQGAGVAPLAATDLIWARTILPVIGMDGGRSAVMNNRAPVVGAGEMRIGYAICPPGQGASLHAHYHSYETFTVLDGRFEMRWNDDGSEGVILERFDVISVPPGVCRSFRNIGTADGMLQIIASGDLDQPDGVDYTPATRDKLATIDPSAPSAFNELGVTFTAGT
jgi:mannose-6-phosphate isomerase-like protein (cupin superfamily)